MSRKPNYHANIMLDLECTNAMVPNPALLQLAAVYFDIDTGKELDHLVTHINLDSCYPKEEPEAQDSDDSDVAEIRKPRYQLAEADPKTMIWLEENIPETLLASQTSTTPLTGALFKLTQFIRRSLKANSESLRNTGQEWRTTTPYRPDQPQPKIWGNGACADNVWIASAYRACDMKRPWEFYNDMCVRTFVQQVMSLTGTDFARETKFLGKKHDALDDCRHQIRYLVRARDAICPLSIAPLQSSILGTVGSISTGAKRKSRGSIRGYDFEEGSRAEVDEFESFHAQRLAALSQASPSPSPVTLPNSPPKSQPTPMSPNKRLGAQELQSALAQTFGEAFKKPQLLTPETSFSSHEDGEGSSQDTVVGDMMAARAEGGLISPDVSFSGEGDGDGDGERENKRVKGDGKPKPRERNGLTTPSTSFSRG